MGNEMFIGGFEKDWHIPENLGGDAHMQSCAYTQE